MLQLHIFLKGLILFIYLSHWGRGEKLIAQADPVDVLRHHASRTNLRLFRVSHFQRTSHSAARQSRRRKCRKRKFQTSYVVTGHRRVPCDQASVLRRILWCESRACWTTHLALGGRRWPGNLLVWVIKNPIILNQLNQAIFSWRLLLATDQTVQRFIRINPDF